MPNGDRILAIDIETIRNDRAVKYIKKFFKPKIPANYKDKEKIDKYAEIAEAKELDRAALHWVTGKIICISTINIFTGEKITFRGTDEKRVLSGFFDLIDEKNYSQFIGKSSSTFDLPFIIGRAIALNLGIPNGLRGSTVIDDVDKIFGWSTASPQRATLDKYAFGLGIDGKNGCGSDVQSLYDSIMLGNDKWSTLTDYCENDASIVRELFRRYIKTYCKEEEEKPKLKVVDNVISDIPF